MVDPIKDLTISEELFEKGFAAIKNVQGIFPNQGDYLLRLSRILGSDEKTEAILEKMSTTKELAEVFKEVDNRTIVGYPDPKVDPQKIIQAILAGIRVYKSLEKQKVDAINKLIAEKTPELGCGEARQQLNQLKKAADDTSKQLVACRGEKAQTAAAPVSPAPIPAEKKPEEKPAAAAATVVPAKQIPEKVAEANLDKKREEFEAAFADAYKIHVQKWGEYKDDQSIWDNLRGYLAVRGLKSRAELLSESKNWSQIKAYVDALTTIDKTKLMPSMKDHLEILRDLIKLSNRSSIKAERQAYEDKIDKVIGSKSTACGDPCALGDDVATEASFLADLAGVSSAGHPSVINKPLPAKPSVVAVGAPACSASSVASAPVPLSMSASGR